MRVRFAPSPTGALHIGGARTALYNWLLARGHAADFVLRIEDTDRERSTPENVEQIFEALRWLGLDWDGDPVFQSERRDRHAEVVEQLIAGGHAYRSTAGPEQVKAFKATHGNAAGFRGEDEGEGAVRLRMPDEGATVPTYAHVPLLHGPDGKKLSKRHGAASVQELRDAGYLPEAVRNYLALLGWGFDEDTTFHSTEELQQRFSLERVSKSPAVFDEKKLRWMNGHYVRELPVEELTRRLETFTGRTGLGEAVAISREKFQTLGEFWPLVSFLFDGPADDPKLREKWLAPEETRALLAEARTALAAIEGPWAVEDVESALTGVVERAEVKPGKLFQPLRVALAGSTVSPGIFETVAVLGRDETLARLNGGMSGLNRPSTDADRG